MLSREVFAVLALSEMYESKIFRKINLIIEQIGYIFKRFFFNRHLLGGGDLQSIFSGSFAMLEFFFLIK